MFYDLNIKYDKLLSSKNLLEETVSQLYEYGYKRVAVTTEVEESVFEKKKEKSKKTEAPQEPDDPIPPPVDTCHLEVKYPKLKIFKRINIVLSDSENIRKSFQSKNIKCYDLISFQPETQNVLKALTGVSDIDIISYNPETKCTLSLSRKLYNQFVNQNVCFELVYGPAIASLTARRNLIALSHLYHGMGKSKNIIVSSGTCISNHIRGPYDVINFNLLFGLSEEQAKQAITVNCEKLLLKSRKNKRGKNMMEVTLQTHEANETASMEITVED